MKWQPIKTAPKKRGIRFLVWDGEEQYVAEYSPSLARWVCHWGTDDYYNGYCIPSYWMPLPPAPESV